jgi:Leucine-rich repeat (LRR) protein
MMLEKIITLLKTGQPNDIELAYQLRLSAKISLWPLERGIKDLLYLAKTQPVLDFDDLYLGQLCHILPEVIALSVHNASLKQLPEQLYFMPNLRILELANIPIQQLPDNLKDLKHLKSLSLRNTLIKALPKTLFQLKNLTSLILVDNPNLTGLPSFLAELPNLKTLRISKNLEATVPEGNFEVVVL